MYEVANAVGVKARQPREARGASPTDRQPLRRSASCGSTPSLIDAALDIAAEHGLTAYDAAYVAAARRNGWTLVSADIADLVSKGLAVTPDAAVYP